jgi:hypothetical protein
MCLAPPPFIPPSGVTVWASVLRRQVAAMIGLGGAGVAPTSTRNMPALQAFHRYGPGLQGLLKQFSPLSSSSVPRERCGALACSHQWTCTRKAWAVCAIACASDKTLCGVRVA